MTVEFDRKTLKGEARFEGVGIHSGERCLAIARPGTSGIVFSSGGGRYQARPENVTDTSLRTTKLGTIGMVEHLMSALAALEITDADVEVEGPELPILDGSALEYYEALQYAGTEDLGQRSAVHLFGRVNVQGEADSRIGISAGTGRWRYDWPGSGPWPGALSCEVEVQNEYRESVAPAKTFCYEAEIELIKAAGLGKGGNETNTLVLGAEGYRTENRFADEPPRHKLVDLIGDIALAGVPIRFLNVAAHASGHTLNVEAAKRLDEVCKWEEPH